MFYKFSKGKALLSVPNGIGDGSAFFDGTASADKTTLKNNLPLPYGNSARSISVHFRAVRLESDDSAGDLWLFTYGSPTTNQWYAIGLQHSYLYLPIYRGYHLTNYKCELNKWYHVVFTFDGTNQHKLYVNGSLEESFILDGVDTVYADDRVLIGAGITTKGQFNGNITELNVYNRALTQDEVTQLYNKQEVTSGRVLNIPLTYGKDDESLFTSKSFVYDYSLIETSSGFNAMGKPIRYRSASGAGIAYFTLPVKDGLVFCTDYKKGAIDTVSKASAECNNVIFEKYNGVDCAYFNGTNSSIVWKNVLTKNLTKYTLMVKFACTYTNGSWRFLFGVSPENNRGQGCSLQMHNEYGNRFYFLWGNQDYSVASNVEKEVFHVGILSVDNGLVKCYLDNNLVYNGNLGAKGIPTTSWLYVGGDYGQSNRLWFEGYIAQSILYDRALNEDEVKALSEV
jgi:hypothetical protein